MMFPAKPITGNSCQGNDQREVQTLNLAIMALCVEQSPRMFLQHESTD